jgi:hypothetical protein
MAKLRIALSALSPSPLATTHCRAAVSSCRASEAWSESRRTTGHRRLHSMAQSPRET